MATRKRAGEWHSGRIGQRSHYKVWVTILFICNNFLCRKYKEYLDVNRYVYDPKRGLPICTKTRSDWANWRHRKQVERRSRPRIRRMRPLPRRALLGEHPMLPGDQGACSSIEYDFGRKESCTRCELFRWRQRRWFYAPICYGRADYDVILWGDGC